VHEKDTERIHHVNGKVCATCARKHKVAAVHSHVSTKNHGSKGVVLPSGNVKGAPYYQKMPIGKHSKSVITTGNASNAPRSSSNFRNPKAGAKLVKPPKFLTKDYNPVLTKKPFPIENDPHAASSMKASDF